MSILVIYLYTSNYHVYRFLCINCEVYFQLFYQSNTIRTLQYKTFFLLNFL